MGARTTRVGIVGTGFIARGLAEAIRRVSWASVSRVLTRRPRGSVDWLDDAQWTDSVQALAADSDIIVEARGDAISGTEVLLELLGSDIPIVTMNSELQITTGSYFAEQCYFTEAHGDQPGCLAELHDKALEMGFAPQAYINFKGYLNEDPSRQDMEYWAERQGIRLDQVVQFTDGSKVQIEAALTANGLGAGIARSGLLGGRVDDIKQTDHFADAAVELGYPISDYVLADNAPPGVMLLATHEDAARLEHYTPLANIRTAGGGYFALTRPFHLCHLEILTTVRAVQAGAPVLINNGSSPSISVAAVAKRPLTRGQRIERGLGSFEVRGSAVRLEEHPQHVPICLLVDAVLKRDLAAGDIVTFDDVELPPTRACEIYDGILKRALGAPGVRLGSEVATASRAEPLQS